MDGADRPPTPAEYIQPQKLTRQTTDAVKISETLNGRLTSTKDYFNHLGAVAGQVRLYA